MSINPLYVPPAPPPAASAPAEPTSTTVSPETASMVVAFNDTQLAITSVVKVTEQVDVASQELHSFESLIESMIEKWREEWIGPPAYHITQAYTADEQAQALLANASAPGGPLATPVVNYLGDTFYPTNAGVWW